MTLALQSQEGRAGLPWPSPKGEEHRHRRRFIGPMPESVLASEISSNRKAQKKRRWFASGSKTSAASKEDEDQCLRDVIKAHAYEFFKGHGGKAEDWGEQEERSIREEMLRRWRQSEWGKFRSAKDTGTRNRWAGASFDIGTFLGVNILEKAPQTTLPVPTPPASPTESMHAVSINTGKQSSAVETFVTAPSKLSLRGNGLSSGDLPDVQHPPSTLSEERPGTAPEGSLKGSSQVMDRLQAPDLASASRSNGTADRLVKPSKRKGKRKQVHYDDEPTTPSDVLARSGQAVAETSAGAVDAACASIAPDEGGIFMRDRMLVRVSHTDADSIGTSFDENQNRITSHLEYEDWSEFVVVWRKERLELYEDHSLPGKEWLIKHKHLAFVVPLDSPRTKLSLYSFVDMTFCFVCPPTPVLSVSKDRLRFHTAKTGLNVFVFKVKIRSRAQDWIWKLWRRTSGRLPKSIEIRCPTLDSRLKLDLPNLDSLTLSDYGLFDRETIVQLCEKSLRAVREWEWLVQRRINEGLSLELAWRMGAKLDWVWQPNDLQDRPRDWAVLYGLALNQGGKPSHLEIRLQIHNPNKLHLKDGTRLDEPLGIEGYLDRIKPATQTKQSVYVSTHDGYLFTMSPELAHPPSPPGALPGVLSPKELKEAEVNRGVKQILSAHGVLDLRNILAVRRAFHQTPRHTHEDSNNDDEVGVWQELDRTESDDEDRGGEEVLATAHDRPRKHMRRSFELLMVTGHVVRLEAYSCIVALEWIHRLRALITYWKKRHQMDAKLEMNLAQYGAGRARVTPLKHAHILDQNVPPDDPPDPESSLPDLSAVYNWCVYQNCRPILKCGKVFARKGLRGQYEHLQLVLVNGHLVQFRIKPTMSLRYQKRKSINLIDAYVCSGYFAAQTLPSGQFKPNVPATARRYADGLETDDPEEDTLFMLWYHPHPVGARDETGLNPAAQLRKGPPNIAAIPPLSAKQKVALFRTRSKLERDTWCWALNAEIEKVARSNPHREMKMREMGDIIHVS